MTEERVSIDAFEGTAPSHSTWKRLAVILHHPRVELEVEGRGATSARIHRFDNNATFQDLSAS